MRARSGWTGSTASALLDLALRGPRPPAGLDGIAAHLADRSGRDRGAARERAPPGGRRRAPLLRPLERGLRDGAPALPALLAALREAASRAGRRRGLGRPGRPRRRRAARRRRAGGGARARSGSGRRSLPALLEQLMAAVAVRPPYGQHPRIFIWGLHRGAAAAGRSDRPRRAQRRRLAGAAGARSLAGAAAPRRARPAVAGAADRPRRPRFRRRAGRARRCSSPAPAATPARPPSPRASGCGWRR